MKQMIKDKFNENKKNMGMYEDGNDAAPNTQPRQRRFKKVTPETYQIVVDNGDTSFFDVLNSMREVCIIIDNFFIGIESYNDLSDDQCTSDDYFKAIACEMAYRCPELIAKKNIHTTFTLTANKLHVRTENNIAFGFEITYKVEDGVARVQSCVGTITLYSNNTELRSAILNYEGWSKVERTPRRNNN